MQFMMFAGILRPTKLQRHLMIAPYTSGTWDIQIYELTSKIFRRASGVVSIQSRIGVQHLGSLSVTQTITKFISKIL